MIGAGDISRPAGADAHAGRGRDHGVDHCGMLAHAEVVVGAPDHDIARTLRRMPDRMRELTCDALDIDEYAIASLIPEPGEPSVKKSFIVHAHRLIPDRGVERCRDGNIAQQWPIASSLRVRPLAPSSRNRAMKFAHRCGDSIA